MQSSGMPPDQLASNLQKLAMLQHQIGTQLARVRSQKPGRQVRSASDRRAALWPLRN